MKAIVTGSFDPFTLGHLEIVKYALKKYDTVYVVALNNEEKSYMFTLDERKKFIELSMPNLENVIVDSYSGLTADYMKEHGITHIVRGVRNENDMKYERLLAEKMKEFNSDITTEIIFCQDEFSEVSSTLAREKISKNLSLNGILHKNVIDKIQK